MPTAHRVAWCLNERPAPELRNGSQEVPDLVIKVVDVFAGPGGLNEGFASFRTADEQPFSIALSIEKEAIACDTLTLRAALRSVQSRTQALPNSYRSAMSTRDCLAALATDSHFVEAVSSAREHVREFTLDASTRDDSDKLIAEAVKGEDPWVLVGGPPCQLYSLVGRARSSKLAGFEDDVRHVLYKEYLHILNRHRPDAFVMENVKGMLSAMHADGRIFDLIREDIARAGYDLRSFVVGGSELTPSNFVIRTNEFGVPQKRHRVILLGVRNDSAGRNTGVLEPSAPKTVREAIGDLPSLRSRISPTRRDNFDEWISVRDLGLKQAGRAEPYDRIPNEIGHAFVAGRVRDNDRSRYAQFVLRPELNGFAQHEARSHMESDVSRYAFYAQKMLGGEKWSVNDLPTSLLPNHKNVGRSDTPFTDRFRVQAWDDQSTTVVSHISKDGHYFIHPDPLQARSLTVREAARLQSFPDDYLFCGNRTQQYHQVGNAVPPLIASQIAEIVHGFLTK